MPHEAAERISTAYAEVDKYLAMARKEARQDGYRVPCCAGCSACCYEPVYVERREAEFIVNCLTTEQREALGPSLKAWWGAYQRNGLNHIARTKEERDYEGLLNYRKAHLACPFLHNARCSIYAFRPICCRGHIALGPATNCEHQHLRKKQPFMQIPPLVYVKAFRQIAPEPRALLEFDHLGVWLAHLLLGEKEHSAGSETRFTDNVAFDEWIAEHNGASPFGLE